MKISRIIFIVLSLVAVYYAGVGYRRWQNVRAASAAVDATKDLVTLYDFMGSKEFSIEARVLERKSGYVKFVLPNGEVLEHSGRYSIITK